MALFSKQNKEVFTNPLNLDHPILGQVLGICSALAVTSQLKPTRGEMVTFEVGHLPVSMCVSW